MPRSLVQVSGVVFSYYCCSSPEQNLRQKLCSVLDFYLYCLDKFAIEKVEILPQPKLTSICISFLDICICVYLLLDFFMLWN